MAKENTESQALGEAGGTSPNQDFYLSSPRQKTTAKLKKRKRQKNTKKKPTKREEQRKNEGTRGLSGSWLETPTPTHTQIERCDLDASLFCFPNVVVHYGRRKKNKHVSILVNVYILINLHLRNWDEIAETNQLDVCFNPK